MKAAAIVGAILLTFTAAPFARADSGDDGMGDTQTASVLTLQGLAVLEQGFAPSRAAAKLEEALVAKDTEGVDVNTVRGALTALRANRPDEAKALLRRAFPSGREHVAGATLRPGFGGPELVALLVGAALLLLAIVALAVQRNRERLTQVSERSPLPHIQE